MKRAIILAGAEIEDYSFYRPEHDDYVICADGGYKHALALGIVPDVLIGDFDSITVPLPKGVQTISYPPEKDKTDLQLSIEYAIRKGFNSLYIIGVFGGRVDHFLGNMGLLLSAPKQGCNVVMEDRDTFMTLLSGKLSVKKRENSFLSLVPVYEDACVSIKGVKYPLDKKHLFRGDTLGISNEITEEEACIEVMNGCVIVLLCRG